jgi:hypothetical protein
VIIPGFLTYYMLGLAKVMPYIYTPLVFMALGGLLQVVGALLGPETKDVEMAATVRPAEPPREGREPQRRISPA